MTQNLGFFMSRAPQQRTTFQFGFLVLWLMSATQAQSSQEEKTTKEAIEETNSNINDDIEMNQPKSWLASFYMTRPQSGVFLLQERVSINFLSNMFLRYSRNVFQFDINLETAHWENQNHETSFRLSRLQADSALILKYRHKNLTLRPRIDIGLSLGLPLGEKNELTAWNPRIRGGIGAEFALAISDGLESRIDLHASYHIPRSEETLLRVDSEDIRLTHSGYFSTQSTIHLSAISWGTISYWGHIYLFENSQLSTSMRSQDVPLDQITAVGSRVTSPTVFGFAQGWFEWTLGLSDSDALAVSPYKTSLRYLDKAHTGTTLGVDFHW